MSGILTVEKKGVKTEKVELDTPLSAEMKERLDAMMGEGFAFNAETCAQVTPEDVCRATQEPMTETWEVRSALPGG